MESIENVRTETLSTPEARRPYAREVWQLIAKTYEGYGNSEDGNLYGAEIEKLINDDGEWRLALSGGTVIAGAIFRKFKGNKLRLVMHNDTPDARRAMVGILLQGFTEGNCWAELSGNLERVLRKNGVREIPNSEASQILEKPIEKLDEDGVHYWREVYPGMTKREMLFGNATVASTK